jgi:hypothetical protein
MKTEKIISRLLKLALLISSFVVSNCYAATTLISQIASTNIVNTNDIIPIDTSVGGGNYATRTVTTKQLAQSPSFSGLYGALAGGNTFGGNNSFFPDTNHSTSFPGFNFNTTSISTNANQSNFVLWNWGTGGYVYNNPNHGPADEVQFTFFHRVSFLPGYSQAHEDAIQMGTADLGAGSGQGADCPFYFTSDSFGRAGNLLGYGQMVDYEFSFWNGSTALDRYRTRTEAEDVNGAVRLNSYFYQAGNGGSINPLIGQTPGTQGPLELWAGPATEPDALGVVEHGRKTVDVTNALATGTNFGVDFDAPTVQDLALSSALNLTNVPPLWPRTNQSDTKTLHLTGTFVAFPFSAPTNWIWSSNNTPPATVPASNMVRIKVEREIVSGVTNYWAEATMFPILAGEDVNAASFITAAGINNTTQELAINQLCLNAKAHGWWTNAIALYPSIGGTSNSDSWNLVATNLYRQGYTGAASGALSWTNGLTGDGTNYATCSNLVFSGAVFSSPTSAGLGVWISTTTPPLANGAFWNSYGGGTFNEIYMNGATFVQTLGPNGSTGGTLGSGLGNTNYSGFMALNMTNSISQGYINGLSSGGPSTQSATYTAGTLGWFNNALSGPNQNVNYTFEAVWQNMSAAQMTSMIADIGTFNATLGR